MAMSTLQDNEALSAAYKDALSPITNYSNGLLQLAIAKRARDQQQAEENRQRQQHLEDVAATQAFQKQQADVAFQRDQQVQQQRYAQEEKLINLHSAAAVSQLKQEYAMADDREKEKKRASMIDQARENGIKLPDTASYGEAVDAQVNARGRMLIESSKTAASALDDYSAYLGRTKLEVLKDATTQALQDVPASSIKKAKLSLTDLNDLIGNPAKMADLRAKAARDGNKEAFALLNEINGKISTNVEVGMKMAEQSKPALAGLSARYKTAVDNFQARVKMGGVSEADSIEATKNLIQDVNRPQQGQPQPTSALNQTRPSPANILAKARAAGALSSVTDQPGLYPMTPQQSAMVQAQAGQAAPSASAPYSFQGGAPLTIPTFNAPPMAGSVIVPGSIPNPQLNNFLQKNARAQGAIAPTAFPADDFSNF